MTKDILDAVAFDEEGFMVDASAWTVVVKYARQEFESQGEPPTLRRITQETDVSMKEMYQLFPGGPAKIAANIAGLQKPTGCI